MTSISLFTKPIVLLTEAIFEQPMKVSSLQHVQFLLYDSYSIPHHVIMNDPSNTLTDRLEYIMLLKLPIILSSNSFYFNPLFPKLFSVQSILLYH